LEPNGFTRPAETPEKGLRYVHGTMPALPLYRISQGRLEKCNGTGHPVCSDALPLRTLRPSLFSIPLANPFCCGTLMQ
jgi:hypothetical protein